MEYLLDTHAFIWFIEGDKQLPKTIQNKIADINNECFLSIASLWEIAIKSSSGKLELKIPFATIADFILQTEIKVLPIEFPHLLKLGDLEFIHKDPFDRLIIAQAITQNLTLLSVDKHFKDYPVKCIWH